MCDVNLSAMSEMRRQLGVDIGYSDHTQGIEVPIAAVALGAEVIENILHWTGIYLVLIIKPLLNLLN